MVHEKLKVREFKMKKFNPEMKVVRFGNEDVIATSGFVTKSFTTSNFGNGIAGDGQAIFNGTTYTFSSTDAVTSFINAMDVKNAGIDDNDGTRQSLRNTLNSEANKGAGQKWNGTFEYDSTATWTTTNGKTYTGVFIKQ